MIIEIDPYPSTLQSAFFSLTLPQFLHNANEPIKFQMYVCAFNKMQNSLHLSFAIHSITLESVLMITIIKRSLHENEEREKNSFNLLVFYFQTEIYFTHHKSGRIILK